MLFQGLGFRFEEPPVPPVLAEVARGGNAARAGLAAGRSHRGHQCHADRRLHATSARVISGSAGKTITVQFLRGGATHTVRLRCRRPRTATVTRSDLIGIAGPTQREVPPSMLVHQDLSPGCGAGERLR